MNNLNIRLYAARLEAQSILHCQISLVREFCPHTGHKIVTEIAGGKGILACRIPFSHDFADAFSMAEFPSVAAY